MSVKAEQVINEMKVDDSEASRPSSRNVNTGTTEVSLRILVPASRTGSIIGKGGEYIQSLRQQTGAKIKIANPMPGCEERTVHITSPENEEEIIASQEALIRLLDRIFSDEIDNEGGTAKVTVRLLVDNSQVGPILGKGGCTINELRTKSGANIRVIQGASDLPIFRGPTDELVQVTGEFLKVKEGVLLVSQKLRENPPRVRPGMSSPGSFPRPMGSMALLFPIPPGLAGVIQSTAGFLLGFNGLVEAQYRMLVPDNKIGCVIGKGGDVIRQIREETRAKVIVFNPIEGCDDRIVNCRSMDEAPTLVCAAQEALCRCLYALIMEEDRSSGGQHTVQLLVPQDQIGAVLGKKGCVIKEIQMHTGAKLVVLNENLPSCAHEEDEVLEIKGRAQSVMQAVQTCSTLMRVNMARSQAKEASAAMGGTAAAAAAAAVVGGGGGGGPNNLHSNHMHPGMTMMHHMGAVMGMGGMGMMPRHGIHLGMNVPGYVSPPMVTQPFSPPRRNEVVMNGSNQVVVKLGLSPSQVGAVIGAGGQNINQIRQISGARVKLHGKDENNVDRELEITGSSEQCRSAQKLVQAFLLTGGASEQIKILSS